MTLTDAVCGALLFGIGYLVFVKWEVHRWLAFIFIVLPILWWFWNGPKARKAEAEKEA